jgi:hypothetical protein
LKTVVEIQKQARLLSRFGTEFNGAAVWDAVDEFASSIKSGEKPKSSEYTEPGLNLSGGFFKNSDSS